MNIEKIVGTVGRVIAERGWDYFQKNNLLSLKKTKSTWLANVSGSHSQIYSVQLTLTKTGSLQGASCSCPCDYYCKHIAAVWFAVLQDEALGNTTAQAVEEVNYNDVLQDLRRVFNRYSKGCDYWQARHFAQALEPFLDVRTLTEEQQFPLLKTFYGRLCTALLRSDDSDGLLGDLLDEAAYYLNQLYTKTKNTKLKIGIEKAWLKWINNKEIFWLVDHTGTFDFWRTAMYQSQRAQTVLDWIGKYEQTAESYEKSGINHWRYESLEYLDEAQAETFLQAHIDDPILRNIAIERLIKNRKNEQAENLLVSGLASNQSFLYREEWQEKLLGIAEKTKQKEKAIQYAEELILATHEHLQENHFNSLKKACNKAEWGIKSQKIEAFLLKNGFENKLAQFFILDKQFEKLKHLLLNTEQIYILKEFTSKLSKDDQNDVALHWLNLLEKTIKEYNTRPKYIYWVRQANKLLKKYPYLYQEMVNMAHRFREIYKHRPALMEELNQLNI